MVLLLLRAEPEDNWTVERSMIDWSGVLVGETGTDLPESAKAAIMGSIHVEPPDPELTAQDLMDKTEKAVEFGHRVGPKVLNIFNMLRGKAPEPNKEP